MEQSNNERRIYTEVYAFLSCFPKEYLAKIPKNVIDNISEKADTVYNYKLDNILPESKHLIVAIITKYF